MDDILERIKLILDKEGISPSELADSLGIGRPLLSHIFSGRNKPSLQVVLKILETYPAYSANWLLTGKEAANDFKKTPLKIEVQDNPKTDFVENTIVNKSESQPELPKTKNAKTLPKEQPEVVLLMFEDKTFESYKLRK
jgi:transcriptional regulator with XRE-family HTH domain